MCTNAARASQYTIDLSTVSEAVCDQLHAFLRSLPPPATVAARPPPGWAAAAASAVHDSQQAAAAEAAAAEAEAGPLQRAPALAATAASLRPRVLPGSAARAFSTAGPTAVAAAARLPPLGIGRVRMRPEGGGPSSAASVLAVRGNRHLVLFDCDLTLQVCASEGGGEEGGWRRGEGRGDVQVAAL